MEQPWGCPKTDLVPPRSPFASLEHQWLQALRDLGFSESEKQLLDIAWGCLGRALGFDSSGKKDLLRGYSLVTTSDLKLQQHVPCCSHLTWSSEEFKEWIRTSQNVLPSQETLQRTHLILIGYLTDGSPRSREKLANGSLYVRDSTGMVPCLLLHFKLEWLESLLLFPNWIYIPGTGQNNGGYLEILQDPVQVVDSGVKKDLDIPAFHPAPVKQLLSSSPQGNLAKVNVAGELSRLSPVLCFHQKTFFFLFLRCFSSSACVPVLVQKMSQLVWHHALLVGHGYVLTDLKTSCLKASGFRVFITSSSSRLLPYCMEQAKEEFLDSASKRSPSVSDSGTACVQLNSLFQQKEEMKMTAPASKTKIISYIGTITQVLNAQAGLYELDSKFILCLAYQQLLNCGQGLRPGAHVELQDVHLVQKPLPTSPAVLGACLRSRILLKRFSVYSALNQPMALFGNLYVHLLLRYNLSLSQYMWLVSILEILEQRFCGFIQQQLKLAEMFIVPILNNLMMPPKQRNIHEEILADEHHCPLEQCRILEPPCQIPHFSHLHDMVEKECLESSSPLQQLKTSSEIRNLNAKELNHRLAWSYCPLSAESFQPPVVLLGILECSSNGFLQLKDRSRALPCVIVHKDGRPLTRTGLIGCLLQVEIFQLVMEQFLQSDFPSWQQLEVQEYIKKRKTRLYVQFCFEDAKILCVPEKGLTVNKGTSSEVKDNSSPTAELRSPKERELNAEKAKSYISKSEQSQSSNKEVGCVSRLFLVTQKEGLGWRNYLQTSESKGEGEQASQLSFQVEGVWISKPELCKDPEESGDLQELKVSALTLTSEVQQKLTLLFQKKSLQWFPFLHTDHLYQFILPQCTDLDVFDKLCSTVAPRSHLNTLSSSLFLPVPSAALFFHVSRISELVSEASKMEQKLFSIAEILSPSFSGSLVSFSGEIVERTLCESLTAKKALVACSALKKGKVLTWDYTVKLSVSPAVGSSVVLDVYIEAIFLPCLWGMLPGARILFQNLQRKISRFGNIYCTYIACSCMHILRTALCKHSPYELGAASNHSTVYLSKLLLPSPRLCQAQAICHVTCVLSLTLCWICSLCSSIFTQGRCGQNNPACLSSTGISKASACILVEDGTREFLVLCKNQQVQKLLGLSPKEWDVIENYVQRKGRIYIDHKETNYGLERMEDADDLLTWYLKSLCRSPLVCRSILLTFRMDRKPSDVSEAESGQFRRFFSNELEFLTKIVNRWNLICLDIREVT